MQNKPVLTYISSAATILIAVVYLLFPVFFLTITTDFFTFPKQIIVVISALILFILWAVKAIVDKKVTILSNPLNIPVLLFIIVVALSTIFSVLGQDSLLQSLPVILLGLFFFATINFIQDKASLTVVLTSLIIGSIASALISIFAQFNIYVLPFAEVRSQTFNTFGAPIQYLGFLVPLLILSASSIANIVKERKLKSLTKHYAQMLSLGAGVIFAIALITLFYQLATAPQKPVLLPFNYGFQIAFASISQDASRLAQSLLVGSGYGTFSSDFTRFVTPTFNSYSFWNLTFSFSSSYILELLATTGVLGLFSFAFIFVNFIRSRGNSFRNPLFLSTLSVFLLALVIPFSYSLVFLLFALLALFVSHRTIENAKGFDMVSLNFVAFKQGLISVTEENGKNKENMIFPIIVLVSTVIFAVYVLFYLTGVGTTPRKGYINLIASDIKFAKSFTPDALKSGTQTYNLQTQAIAEYPYRSDYYRLFSQINLALAANLVTAQQGNSSPSAQVQQNIIGLLQQSINSARQAVTLSPLTSTNWQNLGQIYRNLIGVGQNADQFAIASYNQAINLNPSNPGLRIELGGIYYQLKQWDLAQQQFTVATQLKPDYANAYYNLGKALEEKGDLNNALTQFQTVAQLVANDKPNLDKINAEIKALQDQIGKQTQAAQATKQPTQDTTPLTVNKPSQTFPPKNPKVKIPEPPVTPTVASTSATPTP